MENTNSKSTVVLILILAIMSIASLLLFNNKKTQNGTTCPEFKDSEYSISFETNGGNIIEDMKTCNTCDNELPIPVKKGYEFGGWFYNPVFLTEVKNNTTNDLNDSYNTDDYGCKIGYKDITLYALWYEK